VKINATTLLKVAALVAAVALSRVLIDKVLLHTTSTVVRREGPRR